MNTDGSLEAIYYNNQLRSWYLEMAAEQVPKVYEALKTFNDYCYQSRNLFEIKLKSGTKLHSSLHLFTIHNILCHFLGELVIFSNNRILHGRSAFSVSQGQVAGRHLEGAYYNFDAVRSKIRHIYFKMNNDPTCVTV